MQNQPDTLPATEQLAHLETTQPKGYIVQSVQRMIDELRKWAEKLQREYDAERTAAADERRRRIHVERLLEVTKRGLDGLAEERDSVLDALTGLVDALNQSPTVEIDSPVSLRLRAATALIAVLSERDIAAEASAPGAESKGLRWFCYPGSEKVNLGAKGIIARFAHRDDAERFVNDREPRAGYVEEVRA